MTPAQLAASLARLTKKIDTLRRTLETPPAGGTSGNLVDLRLLPPLLEIEDNLHSLAERYDRFATALHRWYTLYFETLRCTPTRKIDELDDDTIYSVYLFMTRCRGVPHSPLSSAILYLARLKQHDDIRYADGTIMRKQPSVVPPHIPNRAIQSDNIAEFCIKRDLFGTRLSPSLVLHLVSKRAVNILEHLIRHDKDIFRAFSPDKLLLLVISVLDSPRLTQVVAAIEETAPGTIAAAVDAFGGNALIHALRFPPRWAWGRNNPDVLSALEPYLLAHGANPDKPTCTGFSYRSLSRILAILNQRLPPGTPLFP